MLYDTQISKKVDYVDFCFSSFWCRITNRYSRFLEHNQGVIHVPLCISVHLVHLVCHFLSPYCGNKLASSNVKRIPLLHVWSLCSYSSNWGISLLFSSVLISYFFCLLTGQINSYFTSFLFLKAINLLC